MSLRTCFIALTTVLLCSSLAWATGPKSKDGHEAKKSKPSAEKKVHGKKPDGRIKDSKKLSGNEAEFLSDNETPILSRNHTLSGNRAEILSGNQPHLLSGFKLLSDLTVLSGNQVFSGNKVIINVNVGGGTIDQSGHGEEHEEDEDEEGKGEDEGDRAQVDHVFRQLDTDGDGKISLDEFRKVTK